MFETLKHHLTYANVMATLAAFAAIGGGAVAIGGVVTSDGRIKACYVSKGKQRGDVRLLVKGKCRRGEKAVAWNQRGPAGDPGPAGQPGTSADAVAAVLAGDGAGSGLDADLIDGQDSAAFVKKNGDAMSGLLTLGAGARGNLGTATTPTWSFTNDTNTGIYSGGANTISLAAGGGSQVEVSQEDLTILDGYLRLLTTNSASPTPADCSDQNDHPGRMILSVNGFNPDPATLYVCDNDVSGAAGPQPGWIAVNP